MIAHGNKIKLFAGNGNKALAQEIAKELHMPLGDMVVGKFSDGETSVQINESVRGCDVFVIQSTSTPVNDNLVELLVIIDAMRRASAGRITAVMPYFGYARQDRKARARDPITAKLVADLITSAGADRVLTMDLHAPQIQGFFDIPVDNLLGLSVLAKYIAGESFAHDENLVVVSPDVGSVARARAMATKLNTTLAIVDKRRPKANVMEVMNIVGDVKGKTCLMLDDMIDTAGTITREQKRLSKWAEQRKYMSVARTLFSPVPRWKDLNRRSSKKCTCSTLSNCRKKRNATSSNRFRLPPSSPAQSKAYSQICLFRVCTKTNKINT